MANSVAHFSINASNVPRAAAFYGTVFGWTFEAWGPPGFFMINMPEAAPRPLLASLQQRREIIPGKPIFGLEATISVDNIHATAEAITAHGGSIAMPITTLPGIGQLLFFEDPEGNILGAMQYEQHPA